MNIKTRLHFSDPHNVPRWVLLRTKPLVLFSCSRIWASSNTNTKKQPEGMEQKVFTGSNLGLRYLHYAQKVDIMCAEACWHKTDIKRLCAIFSYCKNTLNLFLWILERSFWFKRLNRGLKSNKNSILYLQLQRF